MLFRSKRVKPLPQVLSQYPLPLLSTVFFSSLERKEKVSWRASSRSSTGPWRSTGRRGRSPSPTSSSTSSRPRRPRRPRPTSASPGTPAGTSASRPTPVQHGGLRRTVGAPWSTDRGDRLWLKRRKANNKGNRAKQVKTCLGTSSSTCRYDVDC